MSAPSISGFTFLRNGVALGFPFEASIRSILPLVDEFVVALGEGTDATEERVRALCAEPGGNKIRLLPTRWNERMAERGFVYAQQKMMAQYACTGDWAFYLEGDELLHEAELPTLRASIERHHTNPLVEAIAFDYLHFYGSPEWLATSPAWYRRECRVIRNTIRSYAPDGQFWVVMDQHRRGRMPRAALAGTAGAPAHIWHYGHVRKLSYMQAKLNQVSKYWAHAAPEVRYTIDPQAVQRFASVAATRPGMPTAHPAVLAHWLATEAEAHFTPDPAHALTARERRHRWLMKLEALTGADLSHKHYKLVA